MTPVNRLESVMADGQAKSRLRKWLVAIAIVFVGGAATLMFTGRSFDGQARQVKKGLTRAEVVAILGEPKMTVSAAPNELSWWAPLPIAYYIAKALPSQVFRFNGQFQFQTPLAVMFDESGMVTEVYLNGRKVE